MGKQKQTNTNRNENRKEEETRDKCPFLMFEIKKRTGEEKKEEKKSPVECFNKIWPKFVNIYSKRRVLEKWRWRQWNRRIWERESRRKLEMERAEQRI